MNKLFNRKNIFSIIAPILMYISLSYYLNIKVFSVLGIIIVYFIYSVFNRNYYRYTNKTSLIYSVIYSTLFVIGRVCYDNTYSKNNVFNIIFSFKHLLTWIGLVLLLNLFISVLINKLKRINLSSASNFNNKKIFIISFLTIIICWIPYFLSCYPGLIAPDSIYQIKQFKHIAVTTDHHPVFHTYFLKIFYEIGSLFSTSENFRAAVCTIAQMLIMSGIYSFFIVFLNKRKINKKVLVSLIFAFGLLPVFAFFSLSMWKDVIFGGAFLLFIISIYLMLEKINCISWKHLIAFCITSLAVLFFRNNAIYMYYFTIPFLLIMFRKNIVKIGGTILVVLMCFYIIKYPVLNHMGIERSKSWEYLGIPIQQIGRMAYKDVKFTEKEKSTIEKFITIDNLKKDYDPRVSDGIKFSRNLNQDYFDSNNKEFLLLWKDLVIKHFDVAVETYFISTLGYWYPDLENNAVELGVTENDILLYNHPLVPEKFSSFINNLYRYDTPLLSWQWNIGLFIWLVPILAFITYKRMDKKYLLCYIPIIGMWITLMLASPVNGMLRYVFWLYTTIPFLTLMNYLKPTSKNKEN